MNSIASITKTTNGEMNESKFRNPQKERKKRSDLGIEHEGAENLSVVHGNPEIVEGLLVVLVSAVREIEAGDVHAGPQKFLEHGHRSGCRTQRAHDLRLWDTTIVGELLQDSLYVDVGHFSIKNSEQVGT
jgi:hypothetical protein